MQTSRLEEQFSVVASADTLCSVLWLLPDDPAEFADAVAAITARSGLVARAFAGLVGAVADLAGPRGRDRAGDCLACRDAHRRHSDGGRDAGRQAGWRFLVLPRVAPPGHGRQCQPTATDQISPIFEDAAPADPRQVDLESQSPV